MNGEHEPSMNTDSGDVRRRLGGRSARVRAAVLAAALDELLEVGYGRLSFESVAARAGVHKTTVYRRWPSREALVTAALLEQRGRDVPIPDAGSIRADLRALATAVAASVTSQTGHAIARALVSEAGDIPEITTAIRDFWSARFGAARTVVARAVGRGELPPGVDADLLIEALVGPLYLRLLVTREPLEDEFIDRLVDLLLAGAAPPDSPDIDSARKLPTSAAPE
jgi:AcrR family transcriptional regulator